LGHCTLHYLGFIGKRVFFFKLHAIIVSLEFKL
jgi:hypothetical protein